MDGYVMEIKAIRDAIDACMQEAGQPPVDWQRNGFLPGSTRRLWMQHAPLEVVLAGGEVIAQWNAYYRQALIVVGCVPVGYYDDKPGCPVGPLRKAEEVSR